MTATYPPVTGEQIVAMLHRTSKRHFLNSANMIFWRKGYGRFNPWRVLKSMNQIVFFSIQTWPLNQMIGEHPPFSAPRHRLVLDVFVGHVHICSLPGKNFLATPRADELWVNGCWYTQACLHLIALPVVRRESPLLISHGYCLSILQRGTPTQQKATNFAHHIEF